MRRFVIVASLVGFVASSGACARQEGSDSASPVAPTSMDQTAAKGGGGGKGGSTGGGSLSLSMVTDVGGDGGPNWGDTVTFIVSTPGDVQLLCRQNGQVVYGASAGFYDGYKWPWARNMTLGSTSWSGGEASCTAELTYGARHTLLATLNFTAGA